MNKLSAWRNSEELTLEQASKRLGLSKSYISMLENGERTPSLEISLDIQKKTSGAVTPESFSSSTPTRRRARSKRA